MKGEHVLYKSDSDEWGTPQEFFDSLDNEFHFTLDPCATEDNHKCKKYFTKEQNGLKQNWGGHNVFCNPPYSEISEWVKKSYKEGQTDHTVVVLLIPARTDTKYFHDFIYHRAEIRFVKGRLKFNNYNNSNNSNSAPFPSMLVIYRGAYA